MDSVISDPFVEPAEDTARAAIAAIGEELSAFDDWMDRFAYIIDIGKPHLVTEKPGSAAPLPAWAVEANRVQGCQSKVWLTDERRGGRLVFAGASDAAIVAGLVGLVLRVYSGRPAAEILGTDPVFLKELGLIAALSGNRGNGVAAMADRIRAIAARAA
jgi:cysteine desulfuration protein SufE